MTHFEKEGDETLKGGNYSKAVEEYKAEEVLAEGRLKKALIAGKLKKARIKEGDQYMKEGKFFDAEICYARAGDEGKKRIALKKRADEYMEKGDYFSAINCYKAAGEKGKAEKARMLKREHALAYAGAY